MPDVIPLLCTPGAGPSDACSRTAVDGRIPPLVCTRMGASAGSPRFSLMLVCSTGSRSGVGDPTGTQSCLRLWKMLARTLLRRGTSRQDRCLSPGADDGSRSEWALTCAFLGAKASGRAGTAHSRIR